jgi:histidine triad (HIT) family protein
MSIEPNKNKECPFCNILLNDSKKQIIKQWPNFTAIRKLYDSKNVNFLIISNHHTPNLNDPNANVDLNELTMCAKELANGKDWSIKINNGPKSGQDVFHIHAHIASYDDVRLWKSLARN